ncbi:ribosome-associated translation inhibitor RaiA [bacterium]|nr:ribosome-associated translation inhibitor RaiA [bacterium]
MDIYITTRNSTITDAMKDYIRDKLNRIEKFSHKNIDVHIVLDMQKYRYIVEINVSTHLAKIHCKEEDTDMYAAIDTAIDRLERQMRKSKEKIQRHKTKSKDDSYASSVKSKTSQNEDDLHDEVIPLDLTLEKMDINTAVKQLDESHDQFLIFNNQSTGNANIISKSAENSYIIVEREADNYQLPGSVLFSKTSIEVSPDNDNGSGASISISTKETFSVPTLSLSEAVSALKEKKKEYFMFNDSLDNMLNMLYYRKDANLGLIKYDF